MALETITATTKKSDHVVSMDYDFGDNCANAIEMFGEDVVFGKFKQSAIIDLQAAMRRQMFDEEGEGDNVQVINVDSDTVAQRLAEWKPGVTTRNVRSLKERGTEILKKMSPEERLALLEELEAEQAAED